MPVEVEWDNPEKTILRVSYLNRWTWDEAFSTRLQSRALLASVDNVVDIMIYMPSDWYPPPNFGENLNKITTSESFNIGLVVIVSQGLMPELYEAFLRSYGPRSFPHTFAQTLDEARQIIDDYRQGRWSPPNSPVLH